jgi:hypothetical protein
MLIVVVLCIIGLIMAPRLVLVLLLSFGAFALAHWFDASHATIDAIGWCSITLAVVAFISHVWSRSHGKKTCVCPKPRPDPDGGERQPRPTASGEVRHGLDSQRPKHAADSHKPARKRSVHPSHTDSPRPANDDDISIRKWIHR